MDQEEQVVEEGVIRKTPKINPDWYIDAEREGNKDCIKFICSLLILGGLAAVIVVLVIKPRE